MLAGNRIDWNDGDCWIRLQNVTRPIYEYDKRIQKDQKTRCSDETQFLFLGYCKWTTDRT